MKLLCIAEKPSVAREIEAVYRKYGHPQHKIDFAAFHGHLMKLPNADYYDPKYQKWDAKDLPIIPKFEYVEEDKKSCKALMDRIKSGNYDGLVNACDAGREGELIFYSFYEGHHLTLPVLRFWASDVTEETLKKALHNLLDASQFQGLREASKLRAQFDWMVGINLSRAATVQSGTKVPIGRVQSPTLKLIVDRELEIRDFVPRDFFEVKARFHTESGESYDGTMVKEPDWKEIRFGTKEEAEKARGQIGKTATVQSVAETKRTINPPSLYSLVELQKDAAKYFGFRADKTLNLAQSLYETHKILSYPRTESRFLPTAMAKEIRDHLKPICEIPELKPYVDGLADDKIDKVMKSKSYVDNAKITDHHAIIPTKARPNLTKLNEDEKKLYILVCKRLLSIFLNPYIELKTTILSKTEDGSVFKTAGKVVQDAGYSVLYPANIKDVVLPQVKKGDSLKVVKTGVTAKQTKPPARYNTATLLTAMQNAGQKLTSEEMRRILRDTAGLGTSATRAGILEKLESYKFVFVQKQAFIPTDFGIAVCKNYAGHKVFSAELTAEWESKLKQVENGEMTTGVFSTEMEDYVRHETAEALKTENDMKALSYPVIGVCPICGKPMRSYKNYFVCDGYKKRENPCNGCYNKDFFGHKITDAEMKAMLKGKPTKAYALVSPKGKKWTSSIIFDPEKKVLTIASAKGSTHSAVDISKIDEKDKICKCPVCGGIVYRAKNYYLCSNKNETGCSFLCGIHVCGYEVTPEDIREIVETGKTKEKKNFTWKSGKSGQAFLALKNNRVEFEF